jgi:hypothetical protein
LQKRSRVAAEPECAARPAWEAGCNRDPDDPDDDGPTEAAIPTTDGPALIDLVCMSEDEWDAYTRGSAMRRRRRRRWGGRSDDNTTRTRMDEPLDEVAVRMLGSLMEKELATPDNYPRTLDALTAARPV